MAELLDVVDVNNNIIGYATREAVHNSEMWHRGIHVFLFNSRRELLLTLRSSTKDKFPNTYDCSVSEHLKHGETYRGAAIRGLKEELNVLDAELIPLLTFRLHYGETDNMISTLFECKYDGNFAIDKNEVRGTHFIHLDKLKDLMNKQPSIFSPWTLELLNWYFQLPSHIEKVG